MKDKIRLGEFLKLVLDKYPNSPRIAQECREAFGHDDSVVIETGVALSTLDRILLTEPAYAGEEC